jgi:bacterioferritin
MAKPQTSTELLTLLNRAIARELQVSIQYMWQHVLWSGVAGHAVKDELKAIAIAEMKHAEAVASALPAWARRRPPSRSPSSWARP